MPRKVFITVAEVSGDRHAAALVRSLKQLDPTIQIDALGGAELAAAGATIHHETVSGAAMTLHGAKRIFEMSRLLKWLKRNHADPKTKPDLQICIDSSAINLHFAHAAKSMGIPVLYYVAPQLWASREGRMKKLRADVDQLACILPFEETYFRDHGIAARFVGHPLFDELPIDRAQKTGVQFPDRPPVIGIIPGSRASEVAANLPKLLEVASTIAKVFPGATFLIPTTASVDAMVRSKITDPAFTIKQNAFDELIPQCDLCLCKSGTSTLHVAAFGVPMIVVYHAPPLLWKWFGRRLLKTKKIALVNILAGQIDLVPEFIPFDDVNAVATLAIELLKHPEQLAAQRASLLKLVEPLNQSGASMNVAKMAIEMIESARKV